MIRKPAICILLLFASAGCASLATEQVAVDGAGPNDLLKLRTGPSLEYGIIAGLPDGTPLTHYGCVTELGQRGCEVSLQRAPDVRGYVSADYIRPL